MKTKVNVMKKVLGFVLTLVITCSMLPMTSNAAEGTTVYFKPNSNWTQAGAWFAVHYWGDGIDAGWIKMADANGDSCYEVQLPVGATGLIFCRMNVGFDVLSWDANGNDYVWNQSLDLVVPTDSNNYYTMADGVWNHKEWPDGVETVTWDGAWSHVIHDFVDGTCACGVTETDTIGAKLAGYSLSVDGKIGVNFYMELDAAVVADDTAYMQFTLPDGTTPKVYVNDVEATTKTVTEKTYYVFPCEVAAKEMASTITAQMITAQGNSTEYTYTVRDYADALIARSTKDAEKAFVKAMLNYGAASQTYFGFNASDLANKNSDSKDITAYTATQLEGFKPVITDTSSVLSNVKANLVLESGTKLNVKFTAPADATIKLNDGDAPVSATGTDYVISIDDLNATELDKEQTIKVNTATITCSPLSYCHSVLANSDDANLKQVVRALYDYNKAADAYIVTQ